jgi:hypothetical protein
LGHPAIPLQSDHARIVAASGYICDSLDWLVRVSGPFFFGFFMICSYVLANLLLLQIAFQKECNISVMPFILESFISVTG